MSQHVKIINGMATAQFKKVFAVRFVAYFSILIGFLALSFEFGPIISSEVVYRTDNLVGIKHTLSPNIVNSLSLDQNRSGSGDSAGFASINSKSPDSIVPVSTDFGIVIEKINANSKIIPDVDPTNESEYVAALQQGVAEAKGSTEPGQPGNLYVFSHSVDAPWNIVRFNAVFYLLRELDAGDKVVIFYKGRRYDYVVFDKQIIDPSDTSLLLNRYDKPVLTLQTCDPPGTLLHRLIVRAKLVSS